MNSKLLKMLKMNCNHLKYTKYRINYFADKVFSQETEVALEKKRRKGMGESGEKRKDDLFSIINQCIKHNFKHATHFTSQNNSESLKKNNGDIKSIHAFYAFQLFYSFFKIL